MQGVVLEGGEEVAADIVVAGIDPRRALLELADPAWLDPELARAIGNVRSRRRRGAHRVQRLHRASTASTPPRSTIWSGPTTRSSTEAYRATPTSKPIRPPMASKCTFSTYRTRASEDLAGAARRLLPGLGDAQASTLMAQDLERLRAGREGQPYHAELALDQALWMRPLPELARYRTPIDGLWLCGPGTHPGGGVAGASGYNCARAILDEKR